MSDDEFDLRLDSYIEYLNKTNLKEENNDLNEEDYMGNNTFKMIIPPKQINNDNDYKDTKNVDAMNNTNNVDVKKLIKLINKKI